MTVEELIRKLRDVVLACPDAAQFPVTVLVEYEPGAYYAGITSRITVNPLSLEVEID